MWPIPEDYDFNGFRAAFYLLLAPFWLVLTKVLAHFGAHCGLLFRLFLGPLRGRVLSESQGKQNVLELFGPPKRLDSGLISGSILGPFRAPFLGSFWGHPAGLRPVRRAPENIRLEAVCFFRPGEKTQWWAKKTNGLRPASGRFAELQKMIGNYPIVFHARAKKQTHIRERIY